MCVASLHFLKLDKNLFRFLHLFREEANHSSFRYFGDADAQSRVRVYLGGELVADTKKVKLVWEKPYYPTYYFPLSDVSSSALVDTGETHRSPSRGRSQIYTVKAGGKEAAGAARCYFESPLEEINDHVSFNWRP